MVFLLWEVDSLPNYQPPIESTMRSIEYFSYSELLVKIEISVIVTPTDILVNTFVVTLLGARTCMYRKSTYFMLSP